VAIPSLKDHYAKLMRRLFPKGYAWARLNDKNSLLYKLTDSMSYEFVRIHERALKLIDEYDPRTTFELLEDWERVLGLPDECDSSTDRTIEERRNRILQVLTMIGAQNEAFYKNLASNFGFNVDVISAEDQPAFRVGKSRVGDRLTNGDWRYTFIIRAPAEFLIKFRTGRSSVGDPLVKVGNSTLQCLLQKHKPAHTIVLFSFGELGEF